MSNFGEMQRMMDVAAHLINTMGIELVAYSGQIKDAAPQWRHWATEMKYPGWYMLHKADGKIIGVTWVTDSTDQLLVYLFATTLLAGNLLAQLQGGQGS